YFSDDTSPSGLLRELTQNDITHAILVPTLIQTLLEYLRRHPASFPKLTHVGYGTSPMPLPLLREAVRVLNCDFCQVYGLSESGGGVAFLPPEDHRDLSKNNHRLGAAGILGNGMSVSVRDKVTHEEVPVGTSGELWFSAPCITRGYIGRPEESAEL